MTNSCFTLCERIWIITIEELYKWAVKSDVENYDLAVCYDNEDKYIIERGDLNIDYGMEEVFLNDH